MINIVRSLPIYQIKLFKDKMNGSIKNVLYVRGRRLVEIGCVFIAMGEHVKQLRVPSAKVHIHGCK